MEVSRLANCLSCAEVVVMDASSALLKELLKHLLAAINVMHFPQTACRLQSFCRVKVTAVDGS